MSKDGAFDIDDPAAATGIDFLTELLTNQQAREDWLAELDEVKFTLYTRAVMRIGGLRTESAWSEMTVLDELRCRTRTRTELDDLRPSHLTECIAFLDWVTSLALETPKDVRVKRQLISAASKLYDLSRKDLQACRNAMRKGVGKADLITPTAIVHFGEIDTAFAVAERALPGPAGERARRRHSASLFSEQPLVHIAPTTLDALLRYSNIPESSEISVEHAPRLIAHIRGCQICGRAYLERAKLLEMEPLEELRASSRPRVAAS